MKKCIVITGLGAVTPIGNNVNQYWDALINGRSGADWMTADTNDQKLPVLVAAVKEFAPELAGLSRKKSKMMGRTALLTLAAAAEAYRDAKLQIDEGVCEEKREVPPSRCGIVLGTGMLNARISEFGSAFNVARRTWTGENGEVAVEDFSRAAVTEMFPLWLLKYIPNMAAAHTGILLSLKGPSNTIMNGCASAAFAIGEAMRVIERGDADVMLAGGVDARTNSLAVLRYLQLGWQSRENAGEPLSVSRPFDRDATGFVSGEAAGVLVLEDHEHAIRRGAKIYAKIAGYGAGNDAYDVLLSHPEGRGLNRAISKSLGSVESGTSAPELVMASANGVRDYDSSVACGLKTALKDFRSRPRVTTTRSLVGHTHAASFALDAIAAAKSINESVAPPVINLNNPIADFEYVRNEPLKMAISGALVTGYGFGGHAASLHLRRCEQ